MNSFSDECANVPPADTSTSTSDGNSRHAQMHHPQTTPIHVTVNAADDPNDCNSRTSSAECSTTPVTGSDSGSVVPDPSLVAPSESAQRNTSKSGPASTAAMGTSSSSSASALIISACDKAGMEGIDRTRVDEIIMRESAGSAYMKQQQKRDQNVNVKIDELKQKLAAKDCSMAISTSNNATSWRRAGEHALEPIIDDLVQSRPRRSTYVVVDMDGFYISCELLSKPPELANLPCCVGGNMITTSNYVARRYGVRAAMPGWIGDKLVEELSNGKERLIHIPVNFDLYTRKAHIIRGALAEYDPNLRAYSLDEAYLDIGPYVDLRVGRGWSHERVVATLASTAKKSCEEKEHADEEGVSEEEFIHCNVDISAVAAVVKEMREKVKVATGGLTCSAGLASNFMLAKIASDQNKPNGQKVVGPSHEEVLEFVHPLSVRKVPGIGRVMEKMLNAFDIHIVHDLYKERALVQFLFKPASARFLLRAALGSSNDSLDPEDEEAGSSSSGSGQKGISKERTFSA
eukprot:scaffold13481_cov49-Attheya_sp.AAC.3